MLSALGCICPVISSENREAEIIALSIESTIVKVSAARVLLAILNFLEHHERGVKLSLPCSP